MKNFLSGESVLSSDSSAGSGKGGDLLGVELPQLCVRGVCSISVGTLGKPSSPAPPRTLGAAAVLGLLSELRVPMLIITRVFREELAWPLPTAFSPVLITSAPNFLPLYN